MHRGTSQWVQTALESHCRLFTSHCFGLKTLSLWSWQAWRCNSVIATSAELVSLIARIDEWPGALLYLVEVMEAIRKVGLRSKRCDPLVTATWELRECSSRMVEMLQETPIYIKCIGVVVDDNCYDVTNQSPPRRTASVCLRNGRPCIQVAYQCRCREDHVTESLGISDAIVIAIE